MVSFAITNLFERGARHYAAGVSSFSPLRGQIAAAVSSHRVLRFVSLGIWGVNTFFVLSGFLLGREFVRSAIGARPFPNLSKFFGRRFLRIYPLYFVAVLFSVMVVQLFLRPVAPMLVAQHLLMLQGANSDSVLYVNGPLWTMGVDAAFYLALPPFIGTFMFFSRSLTRKGKVKALGISLLSVVAISCLWRLAATYSLGRLAHVTANVLIVHVRTPLGMATAFALGCLIALLVEVKPRARFTQTTYGIIMFFGILIGFAEMGLRSDSGNTRSLYGVLQLTLTDPIAALSAALILYGLVQGGSPNTSRLAGSVPIAWFASLAYAVYLFHFPILEAISSKLFHRSAGIRTFAGLCLTMVIIVLPLAYFANRFIEQPFLEMKNRLRSSQSDSVRVDIGAAS